MLYSFFSSLYASRSHRLLMQETNMQVANEELEIATECQYPRSNSFTSSLKETISGARIHLLIIFVYS